MERILIVCKTQKGYDLLVQFLQSCHEMFQSHSIFSGAEARRHIGESDYDLILINTPLPDEFGSEFAQFAAQNTSAGVILIVKEEIADAVSEQVEDDGVFVVSKPLNRALFLQALRMVRTARRRFYGLQSENSKLQKKIEDIRLVDRAKCILIECCGMTEPEAHAYIEQQAMKKRATKRAIAEELLQTGGPEK